MKYQITGSILRDYQRDIARELLSGRKKHLLLVHPRRSGKSFLTFYIVNALIYQYYLDTGMPCNATIYAPLQRQAREIYVDNIMRDGRKLLDISHPIAKFVASRLELKYKFGSLIKLTGSDQIDNKMGAGNRVVVIDEAALSKPEAYQRLFPMVEDTKGNMIIVSTPRGRNHFYDLYNEVKDKPDWLVVHSDIISLGLKTQEEYDAMPMSKNYKAQEFMCSWDSPFDNAIYEAPNTTTVEVKPYMQVIVAVDLGMRDATAITVACKQGSDIVVIGYLEYVGQSLVLSLEMLREWLELRKLSLKTLYVPHDASVRDLISGRDRFSVIREMNFDPIIVDRTGLIDGIDLVRSQWHRLKFNDTEDTIQAQEHIKAYVRDANSGLPKHDEHSHCADSIRYLMVGEYNNVDVSNLPSHYEQFYNF